MKVERGREREGRKEGRRKRSGERRGIHMEEERRGRDRGEGGIKERQR